MLVYLDIILWCINSPNFFSTFRISKFEKAFYLCITDRYWSPNEQNFIKKIRGSKSSRQAIFSPFRMPKTLSNACLSRYKSMVAQLQTQRHKTSWRWIPQRPQQKDPQQALLLQLQRPRKGRMYTYHHFILLIKMQHLSSYSCLLPSFCCFVLPNGIVHIEAFFFQCHNLFWVEEDCFFFVSFFFLPLSLLSGNLLTYILGQHSLSMT